MAISCATACPHQSVKRTSKSQILLPFLATSLLIDGFRKDGTLLKAQRKFVGRVGQHRYVAAKPSQRNGDQSPKRLHGGLEESL